MGLSRNIWFAHNEGKLHANTNVILMSGDADSQKVRTATPANFARANYFYSSPIYLNTDCSLLLF